MKFTFDTDYDQRALTAMARALRKTLRRKSSRTTRFFGLLIVALAVLLTIPAAREGFELTVNVAATWLAAIVIVGVFFLEDSINAYIAKRKMMLGTESAKSQFTDESYTTETDLGVSEWNYDRIDAVAETKRYFVFLFDRSHAQLYDKESIGGGTADEFRSFIEEKTGLPVENVG